MATGNKVQQYF